MRLLPDDVQRASIALRTALAAAAPHGAAVHEAAWAVGRAARRARHTPADLRRLLEEAFLPPLRAHHPGIAGDWLWERVSTWVREGYTEPEAIAEVASRSATCGAQRRERSDAPAVVYRLDAHDVITGVNAAWQAAAVADGAPELAVDVVGTSLWAHVTGADTRCLYERVHAAVRRTGRAATFPFRCDAPAERRWMRLTVRSLGDGRLQVVSRLERRAARIPVALLDATRRRAHPGLPICSLCRRVRASVASRASDAEAGPAPDGDVWVEVEELPHWGAPRPTQAGGLPHAWAPGDDAPLPWLEQEVCPECTTLARAALATP